EDVNLLNGDQPVVLLSICAEAGNVSPAIGKSKELWRVREEKLHCQPALFADVVVNVSVELILTIRGDGRARVMAVSLRCWNQELIVRQSCVQEGQRHRIDRGRR